MSIVLKRLGSVISPAWSIPLLLIGLLIGAAYWVGPLRPLPPDTRLVALDRDGTFTDSIAPQPRRVGDDVRFPLVLAAHNVGYATAQPTIVDLSVPLGFHLVDRDGRALPREITAGAPLGRYRLGVSAPALVPDGVPEVLLDTLWLEPDLTSYTCAILSDGVPDFLPRPAVDAALLGRVDIFYSVLSPDTDARQTGVLRVRVDPGLLQVQPATMGQAGPPVLEQAVTDMPSLDALHQVAMTDATCGDPQQPVHLQSVIYEDEAGGRFIAIHHEGQPRKYLVDLNADSIIEREIWDPDGDGTFEAWRTTRYAIPGFLFPRRIEMAALAADTMPADPAFLALYGDTARGPFRFFQAEQQKVAAAQDAAPRARSPQRMAPSAVPPAGAPIPAETALPDSAFLRLYADTMRGPFRFAQRDQQMADTVAAAAGDVADGAALAAPQADEEAADTTPPPPPQQTGPRILGTPVEYPPGSQPP